MRQLPSFQSYSINKSANTSQALTNAALGAIKLPGKKKSAEMFSHASFLSPVAAKTHICYSHLYISCKKIKKGVEALFFFNVGPFFKYKSMKGKKARE